MNSNIYSTDEIPMPLNFNVITYSNLQVEYTHKLIKKLKQQKTKKTFQNIETNIKTDVQKNINDILKTYKLELCENSKVTLKSTIDNYKKYKLSEYLTTEQYIEQVSKYITYKKRGTGGSFHGVNIIKYIKEKSTKK